MPARGKASKNEELTSTGTIYSRESVAVVVGTTRCQYVAHIPCISRRVKSSKYQGWARFLPPPPHRDHDEHLVRMRL